MFCKWSNVVMVEVWRERWRLKKKKGEGRKSIEKRGMANVMMRCLLLYTTSYPLFTLNINQSDIPSHMFIEQKRDIFMCASVLILFYFFLWGIPKCLLEFTLFNLKLPICLDNLFLEFRFSFSMSKLSIFRKIELVFIE